MSLTIAGEFRHFREAIEPLRDYNGMIIGVIGAATDITEEQRAQQELREAVAFRERLMGILGHDLRNPLNAVTMAASQLLRRSDLPADASDQALRIRRSARRMDEMIATLLDFTRLRVHGKLPISPAPADMGEIAREAIDELRSSWPERLVELDLRGDAGGHWDPARIAQMTSNLVANAHAYGDPRGPVRVSVNGADEEVLLEVRNEGPPIAAELIPVLFEPFRRGLPEDRSPRGLGLGLYIAKQIALAHAATIEVESTDREGTTFAVRLPRAHAPSFQDSARR
jgi:signal transduction histidine kinase